MAKRSGKNNSKDKRAQEPIVLGDLGKRVITIRALVHKDILEADVTNGFERLAKVWGYILRVRSRWIADFFLRTTMGDRAIKDLVDAGITRDFIRQLARADRIEVELHNWDENSIEETRIHEAAAEVPWEYLISAATSSEGRFHPLLITRLFCNTSPIAVPSSPKHVLFVESAPGRLRICFDFSDAEARIRAAVNATGSREDYVTIKKEPQVSELEAEVSEDKWEAIHVTGSDTHQAAWLYYGFYANFPKDKPSVWQDITDSRGSLRDGMLLREGSESEFPLSYDRLTDVLASATTPPYVVTLSLFYSGARIARELVKKGVHTAIGFLDEIDAEPADRFLLAFYWAWCHQDENGQPVSISEALRIAWEKMRSSDRLHGTSIVIWLGRSIFEQSGSSTKGAQSKPLAKRSKLNQAKEQKVRRLDLERMKTTAINKLLLVDLFIEDEVNYSLLHNNRQLVGKLTLTKVVEGPLEDIAVQVELYVGADSYPYRHTIEILDDVQAALAPHVKIPLIASLSRGLRERLQSTIYVKVTCGGRTAFEDTRRITLIPVDEWLDDTRNNPWLPSFVLPRDPAILKIINASRPYLIGISDDMAAAFDGYQHFDPEVVDKQVQAIWTALVNEYRFQYVNPPPAYSNRTQRLRTPSEIVGSNSGTCIDLALLLASCFEYIGIYPVIVLLAGHAFVGYWRSDVVHDDVFVTVGTIPPTVPAVGEMIGRQAGLPYVDEYGWRLTTLNYPEIMAYVTSGDLVMLETTFLTTASSFSEAKVEGIANLRSQKEFDSLLDIQLARKAQPPVTPLPIIRE